MHRLSFVWVDVFSATPLAGNGLTVFTDASGLSDATLAALARETRQAETTFVFPDASRPQGPHRVRIFTPQGELPFAGHPTLGTASVLRQPGQAEVVLDLKVGHVPVSLTEVGTGLYAELLARDPTFGAVHDPGRVAAALGLTVDDLDTTLSIQSVSSGLPFAVVVLRDLQKLKQLQPDVRAMEQVLAGTDAFAFYLLAPGGEQPGVHWHARMIERGGEDPATGSAAGCGIAHLVARGRVPPGVEQRFEQGLEIQRPSTLHVRAELGGAGARSVRVGGRVTRLGSGEWVLP